MYFPKHEQIEHDTNNINRWVNHVNHFHTDDDENYIEFVKHYYEKYKNILDDGDPYDIAMRNVFNERFKKMVDLNHNINGEAV